MNKHSITGVQLAISKDEKLIMAKGYGKADIENNVLMGPNHKGRIASISKPITSAAIHKLDLQDNGFSLTSKVLGPNSIFGNTYGTNPLDFILNNFVWLKKRLLPQYCVSSSP